MMCAAASSFDVFTPICVAPLAIRRFSFLIETAKNAKRMAKNIANTTTIIVIVDTHQEKIKNIIIC